MTRPEVTFLGFAPGFRSGVASPSDAGWYATRSDRDPSGKVIEEVLAGPFRTEAGAHAALARLRRGAP